MGFFGGCGNGNSGNSCLWIIILIVLFCCCNGNSGCNTGNICGTNNNNCGCCD